MGQHSFSVSHSMSSHLLVSGLGLLNGIKLSFLLVLRFLSLVVCFCVIAITL